MMQGAGRWNLNFIIFCHGPTLASLTGQDSACPGPWPDLLSLQQFCSPCLSLICLPCRPPRGPCPDPMQCSLQCCRLTVQVYTWRVRNRIGPSKAQDDGGTLGPGPVLLELLTSPWLRPGQELQRGDWSQNLAPPSHKLQVQWTAAPNFATISRMQFEEFLKFSFLRSCGPAPCCNVTPGRG